MKTMRLVIGIICCVLFVLIAFQSCVVGLGNSITDSGEVSGTAGALLAIFMLIAGILGIAGRNQKWAIIVAICSFFLGSIIGFSSSGSYTDLGVWSSISLIFGIVFIIGLVVEKRS